MLLAIIPKVKDPKVVQDFNLISLYSVVYKIVAKAIANRLKGYLSHLIVVEQNAFVPGHQILDNVLLAYENKHELKSTRVRKKTWMALRPDISKAYDRVK